MSVKNLRAPVFFAVLGFSAIGFGQSIQVLVDGSPVTFTDQGPAMIEDRVMVPLRGVLERMGAQVSWESTTHTVTAVKGNTVVKLTVGEKTASVNDRLVDLDVPARILRGSTMVPLRFVGEALGEDVRWDSSSSTVAIVSHDYALPAVTQVQAPPVQTPAQTPPPQPVQQTPPPLNLPPVLPPVQPAPPPQPTFVAPPPVYYPPPPVIYEQNTVVPVTINNQINSDNCQKGQKVTTIVNSYPGIPDGSRLEGTVTDVSIQVGIELTFDTLITPTGKHIAIHGHVCSLDGDQVTKRSDGRLLVNKTSQSPRFLFTNHHGSTGLTPVRTSAPLRDQRVVREVRQKGANVSQPIQISKGQKFGIQIDSGFVVK